MPSVKYWKMANFYSRESLLKFVPGLVFPNRDAFLLIWTLMALFVTFPAGLMKQENPCSVLSFSKSFFSLKSPKPNSCRYHNWRTSSSQLLSLKLMKLNIMFVQSLIFNLHLHKRTNISPSSFWVNSAMASHSSWQFNIFSSHPIRRF